MRKKSIKKAAQDFRTNVDAIIAYTTRATPPQMTDQDQSWCYDLAIIRLYREFEDLILSCLVACINSDATTFSTHKGRKFPNHMNVDVCEYLITGDGYFDFSGRDGLIKTVKRFVPDTHWLPTEIKKGKYKDALDRLSALRNFAAHDSAVSKTKALASIGQARMSSSGAWLKKTKPLWCDLQQVQGTCDGDRSGCPILKDLIECAPRYTEKNSLKSLFHPKHSIQNRRGRGGAKAAVRIHTSRH